MLIHLREHERREMLMCTEQGVLYFTQRNGAGHLTSTCDWCSCGQN